MMQLGELLRTMLAYRDTVDGLYGWSVSDDAQRQQAGLRQTRRGSGKNKLGGAAPDDDEAATSSAGGTSSSVPSELPALQDRLRQLGAAFQTRLQILLGDLAYQPDVDMRFLGVAMNFNDVYQPVHKRSKSKAAAAAATGGGGGGERHAQGHPALSASSSKVGTGEGSRGRGE